VRKALFAVCLLVSVATSAAAPARVAPVSAEKLYGQGRKAEREGRLAEAYLLYAKAAALAPENPLYWLRSEAVKTRAALQIKLKPPASTKATADGDPPAFDAAGPNEATAKPQPQPVLRGSPERKDFNLRGNAQVLFEQVARAFALDTVFDGDYQPGPSLHFQVEQADWREALHLLESATSSFVVPLSDRLFLVAKESEQKRRQVEPTMAVVIPVPQATAATELTEIVQAVRQLFTIEHIAVDSSRNLVVLRDRVSKVIPAQQVFEELLYHRPQVEIEVELLEVDRSLMLKYGVQLPTQFPLIYLGTLLAGVPPVIPAGVSKFVTFGGGKTLFGAGMANAQVFATLARSGSQSLLRADLRSVDGKDVTFHVGQRYPILTSGYFGPASFSQGGQAFSPPPSFTFEDLGIVVKVQPHVHGTEEVTLDLETEFKVLAGSALNGIPIISNRKLVTKIRLRNGEYGFVAGLMSSSDARSIAGIAGVSGLPVVGHLFKTTTDERDTSEILIVVKPHLLHPPPSEAVAIPIRTGSETRPYSRF
jgi:general secretion pathway protein D